MVQNEKKKNTEKIAIQSFTFPQTKQWAKWVQRSAWAQQSAWAKRAEQSKQGGTSERVSSASERTSKWPSTYIWILDYSGPQCSTWNRRRKLNVINLNCQHLFPFSLWRMGIDSWKSPFYPPWDNFFSFFPLDSKIWIVLVNVSIPLYLSHFRQYVLFHSYLKM